MNIDEIVHAFTYPKKGEFPTEAVDAALAQQEAITPVLLAYLAEMTPPRLLEEYERTEAGSDDINNFMWIFSMYLLAQFREQAAFPHIVNFYRHEDTELVDDLAIDFSLDALPIVLASTFNGDVDSLFSMIQSTSVDHYTRSAFLAASITLFLYGQLDEKETIQRYIALFHQRMEEENIEEITNWVYEMGCLGRADLLPFIEQAFKQDKVDLFFIGAEDVKRHYRKPAQKGEAHRVLVEDVHKEVSDWSYFRNKPRFIDPEELVDDFQSFVDYEPSTPAFTPTPVPASSAFFDKKPKKPHVREEVKISRNDPCSCGSGKKYKKCCLFK